MAANLLKDGATWLAGQAKAQLGSAATYRRGAQTVALTVTFGRTMFRVGDGLGGSRVEWSDLDVLLSAADLILGGNLVLPARDDQVLLPEGNVTARYEVQAPAGEAAWRWSDPFHQMLRLHLKRVGVE